MRLYTLASVPEEQHGDEIERAALAGKEPALD
jgi:hypothetical protein